MSGKALEAPTGPKTAGQIRLPFFSGWLLVGVCFVTMAIGVNARTAYSLLSPQIHDRTLGRAVRTQRFRWLAASYFCGLFTWPAVQVHQTNT